jgi:hypothetical protein
MNRFAFMIRFDPFMIDKRGIWRWSEFIGRSGKYRWKDYRLIVPFSFKKLFRP